MMNVRESWQAEFSEKQAGQQRSNTNHEFRRRLFKQKAVQQLASIKLSLASLAAMLAWSFAGIQWLR